MNNLQEEIYNIIAMTNEMDTPADIMYSISKFIKNIDHVDYKDYLESDEFKQWLDNNEEFIKSWKNINTFVLMMIEKEKDYL
jgi:hypothetical protein